jgi:hypothetical protein
VVEIETKRKMGIREGGRESGGGRKPGSVKEKNLLFFFFLNVKLSKRRHFGILYRYNSVT